MRLGQRASAETRAKQSLAASARIRQPCSAETRAKISAALMGHPSFVPEGPVPPEWGQRISERRGAPVGATHRTEGYVRIKTAEGPDPATWKREHRVIYEAANGPIPEGYVVHHTNGDRSDNRLENLEAMSRAEHIRLHQ